MREGQGHQGGGARRDLGSGLAAPPRANDLCRQVGARGQVPAQDLQQRQLAKAVSSLVGARRRLAGRGQGSGGLIEMAGPELHGSASG